MPSLVLIRHGPSAHIHAGALDRDGVERWRSTYDATGILPGNRPPEALVALAEATTFIVASDLPRAIESAERLAPKRPITVSPLVREAPLPIPSMAHAAAVAGLEQHHHRQVVLSSATPD